MHEKAVYQPREYRREEGKDAVGYDYPPTDYPRRGEGVGYVVGLAHEPCNGGTWRHAEVDEGLPQSYLYQGRGVEGPSERRSDDDSERPCQVRLHDLLGEEGLEVAHGDKAHEERRHYLLGQVPAELEGAPEPLVYGLL